MMHDPDDTPEITALWQATDHKIYEDDRPPDQGKTITSWANPVGRF
jgi:hypothetical protein